tara:strand:- start:435 stop:779 length:345 start_codon:yes stop_codon:yes gene_type:complete
MAPDHCWIKMGRIIMERTDLQVGTRNERLAYIVERCLESQAAYKLFDMLAAISDLDKDAKVEYMELVKDSGAYSEEEISAIERLIISGTARYFKQVIDQVREEHVQCEIDDMLV